MIDNLTAGCDVLSETCFCSFSCMIGEFKVSHVVVSVFLWAVSLIMLGDMWNLHLNIKNLRKNRGGREKDEEVGEVSDGVCGRED